MFTPAQTCHWPVCFGVTHVLLGTFPVNTGGWVCSLSTLVIEMEFESGLRTLKPGKVTGAAREVVIQPFSVSPTFFLSDVCMLNVLFCLSPYRDVEGLGTAIWQWGGVCSDCLKVKFGAVSLGA